MNKTAIFAAFCVAVGVLPKISEGGIVFGTRNNLGLVNLENAVESPAGTAGVLEVGERLRGTFRVTSNQPDGQPFQSTISPEITGIFDLTVEHTVFVGTFGSADFYHLLLGPTPNAISGLGTLVGAPGSDPIFAIYEGTSGIVYDPPSNGSVAASEAAATDGTLLAAFGMPGNSAVVIGDPVATWGAAGNGYWYSEVTVPTGTPIPTDPPAGTVTYAFGLEAVAGVGTMTLAGPYVKLLNPSIPLSFIGFPAGTAIGGNSVAGTTKFDLVGGGKIDPNTDPGSDSFYDQRSADPARVHPTPEPTSIAAWIVGMGALGLIARRRWRIAQK